MANLRRVVICKPEPKGGRTVTKLRTSTRRGRTSTISRRCWARRPTPQVEYGMWTNGVDFFFLEKEISRLQRRPSRPRADWPLADETSSRNRRVGRRLRRGEAGMLKTAFRRCHNYIHGNEGMPKDAAFWQFLYLLFAKMYDERVSLRHRRRPEFYAPPERAVRG